MDANSVQGRDFCLADATTNVSVGVCVYDYLRLSVR
jgi:hypothetical protein